MEKYSEKPLSLARRAIISLDLDGLSSPVDPSPVRPSPRRHIKLPSPRPSSFLPKPHAPRDHDAISNSSSIQDRGDENADSVFHPPDAACDFGKIFEDVDNFILSLWSPPHPQEVSVEVSQKENEKEKNQETEKPEEKDDTESAEIEEDLKTESEKTEEKDDIESALKKTDATESAEDSNTSKSEMDVVPECVTKFLDLVEGIVIGRHDGQCRWNEVPEGDMLLLESIDRVSKTVVVLEESKSNLNHPLLFSRVGKIQHRAMSFLEEQLRSLLEESRVFPLPTNPAGGEDEAESDSQPERYPDYEDDVVWGIKSITSRMLYAGYEPECCHVYMIARQNALNDSVYKVMGFERTSMDDVHKLTWEVLEQNISTWIRTCEQCATLYFPGESRLIHDIFAEYPTITSWIYRSLVRTVLLHLLNFAESVAALKRSTEKLFKVLDMYETVRDTFLATGSLFPDQHTEDLRNEAALARARLGETAVAIFCELENSIRSETGKTPVPGGAVHPLTRYTMNYLNYACQYKETLEQVFANHSKFERSDSTSRPRHVDPDGDATEAADENQTPFSIEIVRVMDMLDTNLETKSKLYKDIALSSIFMMNNGRYILQKIKKSPEIHQLMGDTWSRRRSTNLRNYHKVYQRETWNPLLGFLGHEGLMNGGKVVKPALKERFKSFNGLFEEIHKTQSTWVVSDEQMQTELRISISSLVIPAYRSFMGRFAQYLDPGRQTEKYIKFQPEDVEACIDDLFEGNAKKK